MRVDSTLSKAQFVYSNVSQLTCSILLASIPVLVRIRFSNQFGRATASVRFSIRLHSKQTLPIKIAPLQVNCAQAVAADAAAVAAVAAADDSFSAATASAALPMPSVTLLALLMLLLARAPQHVPIPALLCACGEQTRAAHHCQIQETLILAVNRGKRTKLNKRQQLV